MTTEATRPMTSGFSVMSKALASEPSTMRPASAAMVSEKGGKAGLIGQRPAISQPPKTITAEMSHKLAG
jgi:hypothetical protein